MPSTGKSPIRKVTDVVNVIAATGLDVTHAGDTCALHLYTRSGIVRVVLSVAEFVLKARAPVDANGNPFPAIGPARRQELIEGELSGATPPPETDRRHAKGHYPRCDLAWQLLCAKPELTIRQAADRVGADFDTFAYFVQHFHRGELRAMRIAAGLPARSAKGAA